MPSSPLVTIAISCYNHDNYIGASILSALQQSYDNIELLIFDDGSKDDSVAVINKLQQEHNFHFDAQTNMGLNNTLNKALEMAKGKYFVPFGSDDIMLLDRIEKQVAYMEANPSISICAGNILKIDEHSQICKKQKFVPAHRQNFDKIYTSRGSAAPAPTLFFRTDLARKAGGFHPDIALEDLYIKLKITQEFGDLGVINDLLAYYRTHPNNTYKNFDYMIKNVLNTYEKFQDHPQYEKVKFAFLNSAFIKASKSNNTSAQKILSSIPLKHRSLKTLIGTTRLLPLSRLVFRLPQRIRPHESQHK